MKQFLKWLAGALEDKSGHVSSKRIGFFWCLWMLNRAVYQPDINEIVVWAIVGLSFGLTQSIVSLCELEGNKIRGITIDLSQCRWIDPLPLLSVLLFLAQ